MSITGLIASPVIKSAFELLLPVVHDVLGGGAMADKAVRQIKYKAMEIDGEKIVAASKIIQAEVSSENYLTRSWRPIVMLIFAGLLVYQVVVVSIVNGIYGPDTLHIDKDIIDSILDIIYLGLGGYVIGRSSEKLLTTYTQNRARTIETEANDGAKPKTVPTSAVVEDPPFMRPDNDRT